MSLSDMVDDEIETLYIKNNVDGEAFEEMYHNGEYDTNGTTIRTCPYFIVSNSQGGLRSLALTKKLKNWPTSGSDGISNEEKDYLKGLIIVDGACQGWQLLNKGLNSAAAELVKFDDTVAEGVNGLEQFPSLLDPVQLLLHGIIGGIGNYISAEFPGVEAILELGDFKETFYDMEIPEQDKQELIQELRDMMPYGDFVRNHVFRSGKKLVYSEEPVEKYMEITATVKELREVYGLNISHPYPNWVITYKGMVTVMEKTAGIETIENESVVMYDTSIPVGYIVGGDNDVNNFLTSSEKTQMKQLKDVFIAGEAINHSLSVGYYAGLFTIPLGLAHTRKAEDCRKAADLFEDLNATHQELIGTSNSDLFLAEHNQYIGKTRTDGNGNKQTLLTGDTKGYLYFEELNHAESSLIHWAAKDGILSTSDPHVSTLDDAQLAYENGYLHLRENLYDGLTFNR